MFVLQLTLMARQVPPLGQELWSLWTKDTLIRQGKDKANWWICQGIIKLLYKVNYSIFNNLKTQGFIEGPLYIKTYRLKIFLFELLSVFVVSSLPLVSNGSKHSCQYRMIRDHTIRIESCVKVLYCISVS